MSDLDSFLKLKKSKKPSKNDAGSSAISKEIEQKKVQKVKVKSSKAEDWFESDDEDERKNIIATKIVNANIATTLTTASEHGEIILENEEPKVVENVSKDVMENTESAWNINREPEPDVLSQEIVHPPAEKATVPEVIEAEIPVKSNRYVPPAVRTGLIEKPIEAANSTPAPVANTGRYVPPAMRSGGSGSANTLKPPGISGTAALRNLNNEEVFPTLQAGLTKLNISGDNFAKRDISSSSNKFSSNDGLNAETKANERFAEAVIVESSTSPLTKEEKFAKLAAMKAKKSAK